MWTEILNVWNKANRDKYLKFGTWICDIYDLSPFINNCYLSHYQNTWTAPLRKFTSHHRQELLKLKQSNLLKDGLVLSNEIKAYSYLVTSSICKQQHKYWLLKNEKLLLWMKLPFWNYSITINWIILNASGPKSRYQTPNDQKLIELS